MSDEHALRARLIDCAFGAFFAASLIVLIIGQQWMLNLQMKDKHEAAPMFTAGLVLTGLATILGIGRFCVRDAEALAHCLKPRGHFIPGITQGPIHTRRTQVAY